jgi:hypothetical protein
LLKNTNTLWKSTIIFITIGECWMACKTRTCDNCFLFQMSSNYCKRRQTDGSNSTYRGCCLGEIRAVAAVILYWERCDQ